MNMKPVTGTSQATTSVNLSSGWPTTKDINHENATVTTAGPVKPAFSQWKKST